MKENCRVVLRGGAGEITEKKSRFIADVRPVASEEEALAFVEEMRKKYWDARHHCYAFVLGERGGLLRFSDDGEPQGTAGRPILDVLTGEGIYNAAVVVTRYFGGTLLGTGGLVRAYSRAAQEGLRNSLVAERQRGVRLHIRTDYNGVGKIQYLLGQRGIPILQSSYGADALLEALVPAEEKEAVCTAITDGTGGRAELDAGEECSYASAGGEIIFL